MKYINDKNLFELCQINKIPIIREKTAQLIFDFIINKKYQSILEIGTAYGFSTLIWNQIDSIKLIVSVEKNFKNYTVASKFLTNKKKITLINDDAFNYLPNKNFDLIFIDGPKSHQDKLVEKYINYLNDNGIIVIDNLFLKNHYNLDLENITGYSTDFLPSWN